MARFKNVSIRQMIFLPSRYRRWDSETTLEPGEVITVEAEEDVNYLRALTRDPGVLVEFDGLNEPPTVEDREVGIVVFDTSRR